MLRSNCSFLTVAKLLSVLILVAFSSACDEEGEVTDVYSPSEWRELFKKAGGWTPLPIPDSKYRPGSVIQVNEGGVRWIGHLESCRYPDQFTERGEIPEVSFSKSKIFNADVLLNYKGIEAGPEFAKVKKVTLKVSDHSADGLDLLALKVWREVPANRELVSSVCMDELAKPDMYLVTEAFTVSKGTYSLYDQSGAKVKLTVPVLGPLLKLEGNLGYDITAEGGLQIDAPAVFGVRKAVRVDDDFTVLGEDQDEPVVADDQIEALYFKVNKQ